MQTAGQRTGPAPGGPQPSRRAAFRPIRGAGAVVAPGARRKNSPPRRQSWPVADSGTLTRARRSVDRDLRHDFGRVRRYFAGGDPRSATVALPELAGNLRRFISDETVSGIRDHNDACSCGDVTLGNIGMLDHHDISVVLTTLEPTLLTGPMQDIYKIITCIRLSAYCRETLGLRTVPVCWLATGRTQTRRAREVRIVNGEDRVVSLAYEPEDLPAHTPVGAVPLNALTDFQLRLLAGDTPNSEYKRYLIELLLNTRERSATLGEWTARLLHALFHIYGLIVLDESQPYATAQTARCLTEPFAWGARPGRLVRETATALAEEEYTGDAPAKAEQAPFAFRDERGRETWRVQDDRFTSSRGRTLEDDPMRAEIANRHAELHAADWMRPMVQASWLPVVASVVSAPEARQHALLADVYEAARFTMPMVFPRARMALVERHVDRILTRYGVDMFDFTATRKVLTDQTLAKDIPRPVIASCDRKLDVIQAVLDELRDEVAQSNPELAERLDRIKRDLGIGLEDLRRALIDAKSESPIVVSANLERARAHLFPEGKTQERVLNIFPFLFVHGIQLVSRLSTEIDLFDFDMQVVRL